ncbi:MAG: MFS transporter [Coriobacteriia bacterium]|nr:MFS transporter [Coriobacteriia bacterium]
MDASPKNEIFTRDFVVLATVNLALFFGFQMITVGMPVYVDQLGADAFTVGIITSIFTITATLVRVFAGAILDRFGRIGTLISGIAIMACMVISYAIFPIIGVIIGLRVIHGLGWGLGSTATSTIAADIIPKKRFAEGMGYFAMTNAVAGALAPALSIFLVQGPGSLYMLGISAAFTILALVLALADAKHLGKRSVPSTPGNAPGKPAPRPNGPGGQPAPASKLDTFFERRALLPATAMLLVNIAFGSITTFIALHAVAQGVPQITWYFVVYAITTVASRPIIGKIIDRRGYRGPSVFATLCTAATLALIGASNSLPMFCLAGALGGLGIGSAMGTFQAMAVATVPPWRRGVATSTYFVFFDLGIAIGSFAAGIIAGAVGYAAMFQIMAVFPILACLFFLVAGKERLANTRPNAEAD